MPSKEEQPASVLNISCDLAIVGAGLSGINALDSATFHLRRGARVVVIGKEQGLLCPDSVIESAKNRVRLAIRSSGAIVGRAVAGCI